MNQSYYLIGIGGIGMSALARILMQKGHKVFGSDLSKTSLIEELEKEGASVFIGHDEKNLQKDMVVVYSTDIQETNPELKKAKKENFSYFHRSEMLNLLAQEKKAILVTGTHGKTTTSSLLSWVLDQAKLKPSFALGGILRGLHRNAQEGSGPFFVMEADESDGSFLRTKAFGAIVTNCNLDHLNYWKTEKNLIEGFSQFFDQVISSSHLFWCFDDERLKMIASKGISYGFSQGADLQITKFSSTPSGIYFDLFFKEKQYEKLFLPLFGKHNALNAAAVFGLLISLGVEEEIIYKAFALFPGVKRRLEWKKRVQGVDFYDDYGHHPVEIKATLQALSDRIAEKRLVVVFQPHRFSRLKDQFVGFLSCFDLADELILTDLYTAGEKPIEGTSVEALYEELKKYHPHVHWIKKEKLAEGVATLLHPLDVVLTIGAGDITHLGSFIMEEWAKRGKRCKVGLISGGRSAEHQVSLMSGKTLASWIDPTIYELKEFEIGLDGVWKEKGGALQEEVISSSILKVLYELDVIIPALHGPYGEDGAIQGFFETLQIPYVGCSFSSGPLCMDKRWTKEQALFHGIPTAPFFLLDAKEKIEEKPLMEKVQKEIGFPLWVKPLHLGSSIGVFRVDQEEELIEKVKKAFSFDDKILIEKHIEGRQIEFAVLGDKTLWVGPSCEIVSEGDFVDYEKKYGEKAFPYHIPAHISKNEEELGQELAKKVFSILGCQGLARVDFFLDDQGYYWLNEINPFPGCTLKSAFPQICKASGKKGEEVIDQLIAAAFYKHRKKQRL